jgi:hypothetical protein
MKRLLLLTAVLLSIVCLPAPAAEREGTLPVDLAALKPPRPNDVHIAVLPFWARDEGHRELGRACTILNLMRHGFRFAPAGSARISNMVRKTDYAIRNDAEWDPLGRTTPADAARIGRALGARWVIYGEFGELQVQSSRNGLIPKKEGVIDLRFNLVETETGKTLFWSRVQDTGSCGGWPTSASAIERRLLTRTINSIFDDMVTAFPEHYVGAEVTPEEVQRLYENIVD